MSVAFCLNTISRVDHTLLIPFLKGTNTVKTYASDIERDAALPNPVNGMVVFNNARGALQLYHAATGAWVGYNPSRMPVFVDMTADFQDIVPSFVRGCFRSGNWFSCERNAYTDGERVYAAANVSGILLEEASESGVFAVVGSALHRSADGVAAFASVIASGVSSLGSSLVDCGSGKLFWISYGSRIFCSVDGGANWGNNSPSFDNGSALIQIAAGSVDHLHGGAYDPIYGRLFVFTGDTQARSSVCVCDDIDDLMADPNTWKDRWGLSDSDRSTLDEDYVLGTNSQKYRVISIAFLGDYGYLGSDGGAATEGGYWVYRFHRDTLAIQDVYCHPPIESPASFTAPGKCVGVPWKFATIGNRVLFASVSEYATGAYRTACDAYNRLWAILEDGRQAVEIRRSLRTDYASPTSIAATYNLASLKDLVVMTGDGYTQGCVGAVGTVGEVADATGYLTNAFIHISPFTVQKAHRLHVRRTAQNWIPNGRVLVDTSGWTAYDATVTRSTTTKDHGNVASLSVAPTAANGQARYTLDNSRLYSIRGNMVTLAARIWLPNGRPATQDPRLHIRIGASDYTHASLLSSHFDGEWHEVAVSAYIPHDCTSMSVRCYACYNATYDPSFAPIYFSDIRLGIGSLALPPCSQPIVAVV